MRSVKTHQLEKGDYAAHVIDLPNCGGIQITRQGKIERVEPQDMWGQPSETHTLIWINDDVISVHNTHNWMVR